MYLNASGGPFKVGEHYFRDDPYNLTKPSNYRSQRALVVIKGKGIYDPGQFFKPWFVEFTGIKTTHELIDYLASVGAERALAALFWGMWDEYDAGYFATSSGYELSDSAIPVLTRNSVGFESPSLYLKAVLLSDYDLLLGFKEVLSRAPFFRTDNSAEGGSFCLLPCKTEQGFTVQDYTYHSIFDIVRSRLGTTRFVPSPDEYQNPDAPSASEWLSGVVGGSVRNYTFEMDHDEWSFFRHLPTEHPETELFFGMEVECDSDLSLSELQVIVQKVEPKQEVFFCGKSDSTISKTKAYQYEIVTVPMTPAKLRKEWATLLAKISTLAAAKGLTLGSLFNYSETNGVHLHVSKKAFADPNSKKLGEQHRSRFLAAFNSPKNFDFMLHFSGRDFRANRWCGSSEELLKSHFGSDKVWRRVGTSSLRYYKEKYRPCHDNKAHTVEVRVFSGLVDAAHFKRVILFVEAMFYFTKFHSYGAVFDIQTQFTKWLSSQPQFNTLKKELKKCA
jgi:hypothetical protein